MSDKHYHSRAYHQYFEGYAEIENTRADGTIKIDRVYVGNYYKVSCSDRKWVADKIICGLLYLFALFCLILAGLQNLGMNYTNVGKYSLIPQMISFLVLFFMLIPMFYHTTAKRLMIVSVFREYSEKLIRIAMVAVVTLSITAVFSVVYLAITDKLTSIDSIVCITGNILSAAAIWVLRFKVNRLEFEQIPPSAKRPAYSTVIRY